MPTFIKTGFWEKIQKAPKEWLNLDKLIQDKINSSSNPQLPYDVFTFRTTQSDTDAPEYVNTYMNTLKEGFVPPFTRSAEGQYMLDFSAYPYTLDGKITAFCSSPIKDSNKFIKIYAAGENKEIYITTYSVNFSTGVTSLKDDILSQIDIEIRIYP